MKRFQLGGVLVKSSPREGLYPKLTGPARYRGTKRIEPLSRGSVKLGGTAS
ncbi:hypothetical protein H7C18_07270 [Cohnella sp. CBP 2801]|uniref:Uncharacterized protein n=1 Tax=Cohnella zeiphila TaxID=2761120 RepID=A0A7X0VUV8_9BACL|nr:hypothetical protein [Cohnella zeiphila]